MDMGYMYGIMGYRAESESESYILLLLGMERAPHDFLGGGPMH